MPKYNPVTGRISAAEIVASGALEEGGVPASALKQNEIPMLSPKGEPVFVPSSELQKAVKAGYKYESAEAEQERKLEEKYGDSEGLAATAGAARGLTFGLSDVGAKALGYEEAMRELKARNPIASTVGEVGGAVAGALIPVGLGARVAVGAAKATSGLASTIVGQAGARAAAAAVEGAAYGVGQTISDQALGSPESIAENLLTHVGVGALMGGGFSLAGSGLEVAGSKVSGELRKMLRGSAKSSARAEASAASSAAGQADAIAGAQADSVAGAGQSATVSVTTNPIDDMIDDSLIGKLREEIVDGRTRSADEVAQLERDLLTLKLSRDRLTQGMKSQKGGLAYELEASGVQNTGGVAFAPVRQDHRKIWDALESNADDVLADAAVETRDMVGETVKNKVLKKVNDIKEPISEVFERLKVSGQDVDAYPEALARAAEKLELIAGQKYKKGGATFKQIVEEAQLLRQQTNAEQLRLTVSDLKNRSVMAGRAGDGELAGALDDIATRVDKLYESTILRRMSEFIPENKKAEFGQMVGSLKQAKRDWREYRELLDEIGKGAKLGRIKSARQLSDKLDGLSNEIIAERLFQTKNPRILRLMEKEFPEEFALLRASEKAKIRQKALGPDGSTVDPQKVIRAYSNLTEEGKAAVFTQSERAKIEAIQRVKAALPSNANPSRTSIDLGLKEILNPIFQMQEAGRYALLKGLPIMQRAAKKQTQTIEVKLDSFLSVENSVQTGVKAGAKAGADAKAGASASAKAKAKVGDAAKKAMEIAGSVTPNAAATAARAGAITAAISIFDDDDFEGRLEDLADLASNPSRFVETLDANTRGLIELDSDVHFAVSQTAQKAIQFLDSKAPRNPLPPNVIGSSSWRPSDAQLSQFNRYVRAVDRPLSILDDLEAGILTSDSVEAVREIYPQLYEEIRTKAIEKATDVGDQLSFSQKMQLSILAGIPVTTAADSAFVAKMQATMSGMSDENATPQGSRGVKKFDLAGNMQTETARVMSR